VWVVVYMTSNQGLAEMARDILAREGLLARIRSQGLSAYGCGAYEVLVPESEAWEAHDILACNLSEV